MFRGSAYRAVGELDRATDALQALLLEPDNLPGLWLAADVARAEGDAASARSFLQRIIARDVVGERAGGHVAGPEYGGVSPWRRLVPDRASRGGAKRRASEIDVGIVARWRHTINPVAGSPPSPAAT